MFWDGERWVPEHPIERAATASARQRRVRGWLATMPMVLLIPALLLPVVASSASASIGVDVNGIVAVGAPVRLVGHGFPAGGELGILWDHETAWLSTASVSPKGAFRTQVTIPKDASAGPHVIAFLAIAPGTSPANVNAVPLVELTIDLATPTSAPTVAPTLAPTVASTSAPAVASTTPQTPTPVPAPTSAPAGLPTQTPTAVSTATPAALLTQTPTPAPSSVSATPTPVPTVSCPSSLQGAIDSTPTGGILALGAPLS